MSFARCIPYLCILCHVQALKIQTDLHQTSNVQMTKYEVFDEAISRTQDVVGPPTVTHTHLKEFLSSTPEGSVPTGVWMANGVLALACLTSLICFCRVDEMSPLKGLCTIMSYIGMSCLVDINISAAGNGHGVKFEPACSVLLIEIGKLIVSIILYSINRWPSIRNGESYLQDAFSMKDVGLLSLPGALFALNNILLYAAIGHNDMSSFSVLRDTTIFFTAVLWSVVFKTKLGRTRILCLLVAFAGLCMNQIGPLLDATISSSVLLVLALVVTNACASVANEFAIKQNSNLDINMQNTVLYTGCSLFAIMYISILHSDKLASVEAFFANFDQMAWLLVVVQLCAGLLVSRILKYADSVSRTVAGCMRGPFIVMLAPLIGLHSRLDFLTVASAIVVSSGACVFLLQGKPKQGIDLKMRKSQGSN